MEIGARGGEVAHKRKPMQNPGQLVGLNGRSLPQNVYEARGRGRSRRTKKRRLYRERQDKPGRGLLSAL
jgi:hypothetical protein